MIILKIDMVTTQDFYSLILIAWCMKLKHVKDVSEDFIDKDKEMFDFNNYSAAWKYYDSKKLVVGKMKDEAAGVAIKEFVGLKPKMYSFGVDDSSDSVMKLLMTVWQH